MKAYRKDPEFRPVVIEIESEDELLYLYHCLNMRKEEVKESNDYSQPFPDDVNDDAMFNQIDNLLNPA